MDEYGLIRAAQLGDQDAMAALLDKYEGLYYKLARRCAIHRPELDVEDLVQVGRMAAWKAFLKFDLARGFKVITYLYQSVWGAIQHETQSGGVIHVNTHSQCNDDARQAKAVARNIQSLDADRSDDGFRLNQLIGEEDSSYAELEFSEHVEWSLSRMPQRYREILRARMSEKTLEDIGQERGLTKERIRQLLARVADPFKALLRVSSGESRPMFLDEAERQYIRLVMKEKPQSHIARDLRRSVFAVRRVCAGGPARKPGIIIPRIWFQDKVDVLRECRGLPNPWRRASQRLGISVHSVRNAAKRFGLIKFRRITDDEAGKIPFRISSGEPMRSIAADLQCSAETVRKYLRAAGVNFEAYRHLCQGSPAQREFARGLAALRAERRKEIVRSLGIPDSVPYPAAIVLAVLPTLGEANRSEIAAACRTLCAERGWPKTCSDDLGVWRWVSWLCDHGHAKWRRASCFGMRVYSRVYFNAHFLVKADSGAELAETA